MQMRLMVGAAVAALTIPLPALSHHSNSAYQVGRVYLDGREPSERVFNDPTYAGYSTGRWEGDTLVVETVALTTKSYIDGSSPHSDKMTVHERIRLVEPGVLEDRITVYDPEALIEPWETVRTYRKASYPNDELREFACAEGLRETPHCFRPALLDPIGAGGRVASTRSFRTRERT